MVTLPSHTSLLTGLLPYQHGVRDNAGFRLDPAVVTLAERLQAAGWRTGAFVSAFPLDRRFGLDAGFETYDDAYEGYEGGSFALPERPARATVEAALQWWNRREGQRRFLWVHVFTPHFPYRPAPEFAERYRDEPYFGEPPTVDRELTPLLDAVAPDGAADGPIVVLTSDHGESLGEHGEATHGLLAYEATLRVPLVVRAPGLLPPGGDDRFVRHIDLVPSLMDLLGLELPVDLPGATLFSDAAAGQDEGTYFEAMTAFLNRGWAPLTGRIEDGRKAIRLPIPELYDLRADPAESRNLAATRRARLEAILGKLPDDLEAQREDTLDPEALARLRALGYVMDTRVADGVSNDPALDPKRLVDVDRVLFESLTAFNRGEVDRAIEQLERLRVEHPAMTVVYGHLAFMYSDLGRFEQAAALLEQGRAAGVDNEDLRRKSALAWIGAGQPAKAQAILQPDAASWNPETQAAIGRAALALGQDGIAEARFRRALELDATFPDALIDLGTLRLQQGATDEAADLLHRGLQQKPAHAEGWNALGVVRARGGDLAGAEAAWRKAVEHNPRLTDALFNLAVTLGRRGRADAARPFLQRYAELVDGADRARALEMLRQIGGRSGGS